ncbi:hypothetical protein LEP1GSC185_1658 [Leptospira licerasiae serovar Varillal str. VAR 010]|uniref:Uncharacterized protein n=1 Tax=Leptospira licerasiae str. MMD4847 TaxID=1049971 RepID=A0ABP2RCZ6_9LEPT|nr:hypothetical protein LEP1GSC185_1658 [Leptospira licerasiae serovar Varillal str. VAR 010]EJZ41103.1 hypothetical protein LEP1GSC178_0920 [Leptospira licerasiae str. MMD4847]
MLNTGNHMQTITFRLSGPIEVVKFFLMERESIGLKVKSNELV